MVWCWILIISGCGIFVFCSKSIYLFLKGIDCLLKTFILLLLIGDYFGKTFICCFKFADSVLQIINAILKHMN